MAKTSGAIRYRDYTPANDGYTYRVYEPKGETITIMASPRGGVGTQLNKGDPVTGRAWSAVTAQIASYKAGKMVEAINTTTMVAQAIIASTVRTRKRKKQVYREPEAVEPMDDAPAPAPLWPWLVGAGALLVVVVAGRR